MTVQELTTILGKNIQKHRLENGWSQEILAEKMDVSINTISELETGKNFARAETLINFASLFNAEVYELLKPDNILPDDIEGVLVKYSNEAQLALENLKKSYLDKIKTGDKAIPCNKR